MRRMIIALFLLFLSHGIFAQEIAISETFKKTIESIAKKRIKHQIIEYVSRKDVATGIIARDLIGQMLDSYKDKNKILTSITNVVCTGLFINNLKSEIKSIIAQYPEIEQIAARNADWSRSELIAYSSLYFYYSERMKYNLYISPYVFEMVVEKNKIESLEITKDGRNKKWIHVVASDLIKKKRENVIFDVRALELLQFVMNKLIEREDGFGEKINSAVSSFKKSYAIPIDDKLGEQIFEIYDNKTASEFFSAFANLFVKHYRSEKNKDKDQVFHLINEYFDPLLNIILSSQYRFVDKDEITSKILQTVQLLLSSWIVKTREQGIQLDYVFSLAGTVLKENEVDFTILDQLRFAYHKGNITFFLFVGGLFDPIIKKTIYKDGAKFYLTGGGVQFTSIFFTFTAGFPYENFNWKEVRFGISIGYEIPVSEIID